MISTAGWVSLIVLFAFVATAVVFALGLRANRADWGSLGLNALDGLNRLYCRYYHGLKSPLITFHAPGPALVAANHRSGLDPMVMIASCTRPLRFLIAREQYERFGFQWFFAKIGCIPVDRERRPENAMREAIRALKQGEVVALFPQGGIELHPERIKKLKGGVARLAKLTKAPVYPLYIEGINRLSAGHTLPAVIIPSRVRVHCQGVLSCHDMDEPACLEVLRDRIFSKKA